MEATANKHFGRLNLFPPYVGGDDDEITSWRPECNCGFKGRETEFITLAYSELTDHLNGEIRKFYVGLEEIAELDNFEKYGHQSLRGAIMIAKKLIGINNED